MRKSVVPLEYDSGRYVVGETVASLVRNGADARRLFGFVERLVAAIVTRVYHEDDGHECNRRKLFKKCNRLEQLLLIWDEQSPTNKGYWQDVADTCDALHKEICSPLDCLALGNAEVVAVAIKTAACRRGGLQGFGE